jgi:hypothetical protein
MVLFAFEPKKYVGANLPPSPLAEASLRPGYGGQVGGQVGVRLFQLNSQWHHKKK